MPLSRVESSREILSLVIKAGAVWDVTIAASDGERVAGQFRTEIGDVLFESFFIEGATAKAPPSLRPRRVHTL